MKRKTKTDTIGVTTDESGKLVPIKEDKNAPRQLHGDISGVCYNCLNGFHKGCDQKHCTCAAKKHKSWWWKTEAEIKAESRWESTNAFVATCKAVDAITKAKQELKYENIYIASIEDVNTLQDVLKANGYAIQKIKT